VVLTVVEVVVARDDAQRVEEVAVHRVVPDVAHRAGAEQGQHQEVAFGYAPARQGDAEVGGLQRQAQPGGRIEDAAHADGEVDQETPGVAQRFGRPRLQQVVGDRDWQLDVGEEVVDR